MLNAESCKLNVIPTFASHVMCPIRMQDEVPPQIPLGFTMISTSFPKVLLSLHFPFLHVLIFYTILPYQSDLRRDSYNAVSQQGIDHIHTNVYT